MEQQYRTLKLVMEADKYDIIALAIKEVQKYENVNDARALELICADFLADK